MAKKKRNALAEYEDGRKKKKKRQMICGIKKRNALA